MINQIDALQNPLAGAPGQLPGAGLGPNAQLGSAAGRCNHCHQGKRKQMRELAKAKMDPMGELARDTLRAKGADLRSKMALAQGDLLGAAFFGQMSQKAQHEMGMDVAAGMTSPGGIGAVGGVGTNPFLGV